MHPERENPGHAYEKRAPALRWDGAPRMVNPALADAELLTYCNVLSPMLMLT